MTPRQLHRLAAIANAAASRRGVFAALAAISAALGAAASPFDTTAADAKRGRKKKKRRKQTCQPCFEKVRRKRGKHGRRKALCRLNQSVCPDNCAVCFALAGGGTACSSNFSGSCTECASSADCPAETPQCATSIFNLSTGSATEVCVGGGFRGFCARIGPCSDLDRAERQDVTTAVA